MISTKQSGRIIEYGMGREDIEMGIYKKLFWMSLVVILLSACNYGTVEWHEDFRFTGTVEKKLIDEGMLVIKEYDAPEGKKQGLTYRIPVDKIEEYKVGDNLLVIVEANIEEDIWDLDHLRFEIEPIENQ